MPASESTKIAAPDQPTAVALIDPLRAVLPGFGEITVIRTTAGCVQFRATHGNGDSYSVFVAPNRLAGFSEADCRGFLPDARLAMGVQHRNLIPSLHLTQIPGHFVLITELAEGPTLGQWISEKRIDRHSAVAILAPVVDAVGALHQAGVLHRALNPEAVMLAQDGSLRLLGAGFANLLLPLWSAGCEARGERLQSYLPPETGVGGLAETTAQADIFSLGVIHYLALTGAVPRGSFFALPSQKARVETYVDCAVSRAIQSRPAQRHADVAELVEELCGQRPRESSDHLLSRSDENASLLRRERIEDGLFSWLTRRRLVGGIAFVLLMAGLVGYIVWEREKLADAMAEADIDRILALLAEADADLAAKRNPEAIAKLADVAEKAEISPQVLARILGMLQKAGEYEEALRIAQIYRDRAEPSMAEFEEFVALFEGRTKDIREFLDLRDLASNARAADRPQAERDLLERAARLMPEDETIARQLAENPYQIREQLVRAIADLKAKNPAQKEWRFHAAVGRGAVRLNLSGNAALRDIAPLGGLPLRSLDLSDCAVDGVGTLAGMPLRELVLDRNPTRSLEPLARLPLQRLSLHGVRAAIPAGEWFVEIPHRPGDPAAKLTAPEEAMAWENSVGMRFQPLEPGSHALLGIREVTIGDFAEFIGASSRSKASRSVSVYRSGEWQRAETDSWRRPGFDTDDAHPVVGVTFEECEDFCRWLTDRERRKGILTEKQRYRLPTDCEWSLAADWRENPMVSAAARMRGRTTALPVATEQPLLLSEGCLLETDADAAAAADGQWIRHSAIAMPENGFHDLAGNAREWCEDSVDSAGVMRILRGGGVELGSGSRLARGIQHRLARTGDVGFRVLLELRPPRDYSRLAHLIEQKKWDAALRLAHDQSVRGTHPAERDAGEAALRLIRLATSPGGSSESEGQFQGHRYDLVRLPATWSQAEKIARSVGGCLVSVTTDEEEQWIRRHFFNASPDSQGIWLGASNGTGGDRWTWSSAEPWRFQPAGLPPAQEDPNQPDYREMALALLPGEPHADGFAPVWEKRPCSETNAFVIEWENDDSGPSRSLQAIRPGQPHKVVLVDEE